jgi:hypothetical protein
MSARLALAAVRRRLRARRTRSDAGITLAELVVAMGLSTLIGALTLGLFISITKSSGATTDRAINTGAARNLIQSWTAYLRVADGTTPGSRVGRIEWLTASDMLFYSDLYNRSMTSVSTTASPTMVWLRRDSSGALVEEQFTATATAGTKPTMCRTLLTSTVVTGSLFTAWDSSASPMSSLDLGTAPTASKGCVALPVTVPSQVKNSDAVAQANLQTVFSVVIDFIVRDSRSTHPIEFRSQATLPSLGAVQ